MANGCAQKRTLRTYTSAPTHRREMLWFFGLLCNMAVQQFIINTTHTLSHRKMAWTLSSLSCTRIVHRGWRRGGCHRGRTWEGKSRLWWLTISKAREGLNRVLRSIKSGNSWPSALPLSLHQAVSHLSSVSSLFRSRFRYKGNKQTTTKKRVKLGGRYIYLY